VVNELREDIREVISIGKLVRKDDGPEDIGNIVRTITKYSSASEEGMR